MPRWAIRWAKRPTPRSVPKIASRLNELANPRENDVIRTSLDSRIWREASRDPILESRIVHQARELADDVDAQIEIRGGHVIEDLLASVNQRGDVGEVTAAHEIAVSAVGECLELRARLVSVHAGTISVGRFGRPSSESPHREARTPGGTAGLLSDSGPGLAR